MSRRRNRGVRAPDALPAATSPVATPAAEAPSFTFSRPTVVNATNATIDDFVLITEIQEMARAAKDDQEVSLAILGRFRDVRDLLNRMIVGGVGDRPSTEFFPLLNLVMREFGALGNPKN
jgi:hypothetical protein